MEYNIILYASFQSSSSQRVIIALEMKKLRYTIASPANMSREEYIKLNPLNKIPTLIINDKPISQSMAIIDYLDEQFPDYPLYPDDLFKKSYVKEITQIVVSDIQPLQGLALINFLQESLKTSGITQEQYDATNFAKHHIKRGLDGIESRLEYIAGRFCIGDTITVADIVLFPQCMVAVKRFGFDLSKYLRINLIIEELKKIDAFKVIYLDARYKIKYF